MIQRNLLLAIRRLKHSKSNTLINVCGLGIAAAAFLLLIQYVRFEKSYEDFHGKADRIARVTIDLYNGPELVDTDCETYPPLGPVLKKELPEVLDYVRFQDFSPAEVKSNNTVFALDKFYAADPSVFSVFDYHLVQGDKLTALAKPMQAVISEKIAKQLFGSAPAMGQMITVNMRPVVVTGVIKDVPPNTHLRFDLLLSFSSLPSLGWDTTSWQGNNNYTYLLLKDKNDLASVNRKIDAFAKSRLKQQTFIAQHIRDIHLHSNRGFEPDINGDSKTVSFLTVVAILIVVIGCINYVNLVTANASERAREAGMRRLLGSTRSTLMRQYLVETLIITVLAFLFALLLVQVIYPYYADLTGREFKTNIFGETYFWSAFTGLFLVIALISGLYPALVLSSVKPSAVIRRTFTKGVSGNFLRQALVVGQFSVAIVVVIASVVVYRQVQFMRNQQMGMNISQVLVLKGPINSVSDSLRGQKVSAFRNELLKIQGVDLVSSSGAVPGENVSQLNTTTGIVQYGSNIESGYNYANYDIDENFIPGLEMKMVAGRNFRSHNSLEEVIINQEACRLLGFKTADAAIGSKITYGGRGRDHSIVVGVVRDYKQRSVKESMLPIIHTYSKTNDSHFSLKINTANVGERIAAIRRVWKNTYPENSFEYFFLDDLIERQYRADLRFGKIISIFSALTLFITCLGILGLTAATISGKTREIGIRKVLGASIQSIVSLISGSFVKLVFCAIIIASPVAWFLMNEWLEDYHSRINIGLWVFVAAGTLALVLALVTISFQAIRAAMANPVDSLKAE
jgi:putative ABC transport system permease protein